MTTSSERINNMFANSSTWSSKEAELKGRAAIHASQVNRYSAANARAFAGSTVSQEDLEKEREASQKRKAAEQNELAQLLEEQKADVSKGQKLAFAAKVEKKVEKKMPVLSVKKPRTDTEKAEANSKENNEEKGEKEEKEEKGDGVSKNVNKTEAGEASGGLGIGLAYSDSESES